MNPAIVFLLAGIAVEIDLHRVVEGALDGEKGRIGGDGDLAGSLVVNLQSFVVKIVLMVQAHEEVVGLDLTAASRLVHADGDGGAGGRGLCVERGRGQASVDGKNSEQDGAGS